MTNQINVGFEVKALSKRQFEGHGSIFGNIDLGGDIVMPGAFKRSLAQHAGADTLPQMFWMHDAARVPGRWVEMGEDSKGLSVKGELADTELGREMHTLLGMKAVRGLSIGYRTVDADFDNDGNRRLKEVELWEVSLVSLAMNPLAQVEAAKAQLSRTGEYVPTEREFERILRDVGCTKTARRTIISRIFDTETGGMPADGGRWDAGDVDPEAAEIMKSLDAVINKAWADAFRG